MNVVMDPKSRPEDNISKFMDYLRKQDPDLGDLIARRIGELSDSRRSSVSRREILQEALSVLAKREGGK